MRQASAKAMTALLATVLFLNVSGCGYIIHPERRGQTHGRIDPGIAILDGVGLILFLVPGIIAFAVDFSTGAIYCPGGGRCSLDAKDLRACRFDARGATPAVIERIVLEQTGRHVRLDADHVQAFRLESLTDLPRQLARLQEGSSASLIASAPDKRQ